MASGPLGSRGKQCRRGGDGRALALLSGYLTASIFRLSAFDRRAVTIETGIQNSGLGLVLIFAFFQGLGGMAVVAAAWGIWHAISGIALASVMSRTEAAR